MSNTRDISLMEVLEWEEVDSEIMEQNRWNNEVWGVRKDVDGKFWQFGYLSPTNEDGILDANDDIVKITEVHRVPKTVEVWQDV